MIVHLLNSSVMPQPGQYNLVMIDKTVFIDQVKNFFHTKQLINYIGYPQWKFLPDLKLFQFTFPPILIKLKIFIHKPTCKNFIQNYN
jgi:hypothetical protein